MNMVSKLVRNTLLNRIHRLPQLLYGHNNSTICATTIAQTLFFFQHPTRSSQAGALSCAIHIVHIWHLETIRPMQVSFVDRNYINVRFFRKKDQSRPLFVYFRPCIIPTTKIQFQQY